MTLTAAISVSEICGRRDSGGNRVDTKKKGLLGNQRNAGRQWCQRKSPELVQANDFPAPSGPRAHPYRTYGLGRNTGSVHAGTDHDTDALSLTSKSTSRR